MDYRSIWAGLLSCWARETSDPRGDPWGEMYPHPHSVFCFGPRPASPVGNFSPVAAPFGLGLRENCHPEHVPSDLPIRRGATAAVLPFTSLLVPASQPPTRQHSSRGETYPSTLEPAWTALFLCCSLAGCPDFPKKKESVHQCCYKHETSYTHVLRYICQPGQTISL